jgi:hypothetical protein
MTFTTVQYRVLGSALVTAGLTLAYVGCVSSSDDTKPSNNGGNAATAGSGTGGSTAGSGNNGTGAQCPKPTQALISDFTAPEAGLSDAGDITFGDFTNTLSGGTYIYPNTALTSDMSGGNWHVSGTVGDYSGLGLYIKGCAVIDASAYRGISFTISGTINSPAPNTLTMDISIVADTVATSWYTTYDATVPDPNLGTCVPKSNNQYDGTCGDPQKLITISSNPTTVTVLWEELTGGKPAANVDPATITHIGWFFPWTGAGQAPYTVDITMDDLKFVE